LQGGVYHLILLAFSLLYLQISAMPQPKRKRTILQIAGSAPAKRQKAEAAPTNRIKKHQRRTEGDGPPKHSGDHSGGGGSGVPLAAHRDGHASATPSGDAPRGWHCRSVIDRQAAEAVARLLQAAETRSSGATIKSLTLAPHIVHKKPTFAVTCETLKRERTARAR
jgi:hypothetical protein